MCGIFSIIKQLTKEQQQMLYDSFMKGVGRGPEYSVLKEVFQNVYFGFHRLAINGLNTASHQPIVHDGVILICNGEIYNYKELREKANVTFKTDSDCEIILHMYVKYGFEYTVQQLDGVFAIQLLDIRNADIPKLYIARDPFGVRPLFSYYDTNESTHAFGFSSEMKMITDFETNTHSSYAIHQFPPSHYQEIKYDEQTRTWVTQEPQRYYTTNIYDQMQDEESALICIKSALTQAVRKRVDNTERPVACLLSGGLDSSLICALVNKVMKENGGAQLETFSIGLEGSVDLKYARKVADHIQSKHHEIIVSEQEFLDAIPTVVQTIESYDTTTVRASVGNYLVSKYIREHSDAKVIFNGDGSDEVCGGYMYFHCAPDSLAFDAECKRLLEDIHYFDVLRSDRSISAHGLEARTPFLDRNFVQTYLSISKELRNHASRDQCEKYLLRKAFDSTNLLPKEVLWRTKEAFSDGVSSQTRSWYEIIQEYVKQQNAETVPSIELTSLTHNIPTTFEQRYYRSLFETMYTSRHTDVIPYFWMPRFVENAKDASARTLDIYKKTMKVDETDAES